MSKDRLPPHCPDSEKALIGCILLNPIVGYAEALSLGITEESFYDFRNATLLRVIGSMVDEGTAVDLITLSERLRKLDLLDKLGGVAVLAGYADAAPSAANLPYYVEIVKEHAMRRKAVQVCTELVQMAYESPDKFDAVLDQSEAAFLAIRQFAQTGEAKTLKEILPAVMNNLEARWAGKRGLPTGFADIDRNTNGGMQDGNYWVVAARPNTGKTAWAMNVAENAAQSLRSGEHVLVFSLEMMAEDLAERVIASKAHVNTRKEKMVAGDMPKLTHAFGGAAILPIIIDDTTPLTVNAIRARARRHCAANDLRLIIIDYLQMVASEPGARVADRRVQVDGISRGIKSLAKELRIPILALAQLNRALESDNDRKPRMSDLREAGGIEQDADVIGFLYTKQAETEKPPCEPRTIRFLIAKQRNGPKDVDIPLTFFPDQTRFENQGRIDPRDIPQ